MFSFTDNELREECERRRIWVDYEGMSPKFWKDCCDDYERRNRALKAQAEADYAALADILRWARQIRGELPKPSAAVTAVADLLKKG